MATTLDYFTSRYLKGAGELKERCIQRWNLATDIFASGAFASGYFGAIKIDGPVPAGYVLISDAEGWGTWGPAPSGSSPSGSYLSLDQAEQQTIINGAPIMDAGMRANDDIVLLAGKKLIFDGS